MEDKGQVLRIGSYEYKETEKLGQGAYGTVFRGRRISRSSSGSGSITADEQLLEVALKRVPSGMLKDSEVDSALKTHHSPYVVDLYDLVDTDDATYVIMELLDSDLGDFLQKYGSLTEENFDTLVKCLAEGYSVLYKNGVVHRDIKPQNILLKLKPDIRIGESDSDSDSDSKPATETPAVAAPKRQPKIQVAKISDFGCSRDSKDVLANLVGTFLYMAPEVGACIVESHLYNEEIDMWSIGVVLYECLQGDVPFTEQDLCKLFLRAMDGNYFGYKTPVPVTANDKYKCIIGRMLALDPSVRLSPKEFHEMVFDAEKENHNMLLLTVGPKSPGAVDFKANIKRTASALFSRMNIFRNVK